MSGATYNVILLMRDPGLDDLVIASQLRSAWAPGGVNIHVSYVGFMGTDAVRAEIYGNVRFYSLCERTFFGGLIPGLAQDLVCVPVRSGEELTAAHAVAACSGLGVAVVGLVGFGIPGSENDISEMWVRIADGFLHAKDLSHAEHHRVPFLVHNLIRPKLPARVNFPEPQNAIVRVVSDQHERLAHQLSVMGFLSREPCRFVFGGSFTEEDMLDVPIAVVTDSTDTHVLESMFRTCADRGRPLIRIVQSGDAAAGFAHEIWPMTLDGSVHPTRLSINMAREGQQEEAVKRVIEAGSEDDVYSLPAHPVNAGGCGSSAAEEEYTPPSDEGVEPLYLFDETYDLGDWQVGGAAQSDTFQSTAEQQSSAQTPLSQSNSLLPKGCVI